MSHIITAPRPLPVCEEAEPAPPSPYLRGMIRDLEAEQTIAAALRAMRNSPPTEAAGWRDAEDAHFLHGKLLDAGLCIRPLCEDRAPCGCRR